MPPNRCPQCEREMEPGEMACTACAPVDRSGRERVHSALLRVYNVGCLTVLALLTAFFVWQMIRFFG